MPTEMKGSNIVWIDMEMTGLDVDKNRVIQVAIIITDSFLNIVSPEFCTTIHQNEEVLDGMNEWCKENLKELAKNSRNCLVSEKEAEELMLKFIKTHIAEPGKSPLAGNSIYVDRVFLRKYFPNVHDYLHYRIIDVSSIKELCYRWNKPIFEKAPVKKSIHDALSDIKESIEELKFYKDNFFKVDA